MFVPKFIATSAFPTCLKSALSASLFTLFKIVFVNNVLLIVCVATSLRSAFGAVQTHTITMEFVKNANKAV